jgi:hydroxyacylglutathione hydrolase
MPAEIRAFRCLSDNIGALIRDPATGACAAIDAPEEAPIVNTLQKAGWTLSDIIVTHRHADHVQGIEGLKRRYGCRVVAPEKARGQVPAVDAYVREGDTVRIGELAAHVWETPGHCIDHVVYWFAADRALFAGDTLFTLGCGRLFEGTPQQMWASLLKLRALPGDAQVFCGHEYTESNARFALAVDPDNPALKRRAEAVKVARAEGRSTVPASMEEERAANPFLRADDPKLAAAVGMAGAPPVQVFAEIRRRKDNF